MTTAQNLKTQLNQEILNPDIKKLYKHYEKTHGVKYEEFTYSTFIGVKLCKDGNKIQTNHYTNIFGEFHRSNMNYYKQLKSDVEFHRMRLEKNGIEVLGMKPSIKTADGKFKYEGVSIKELKEACKINKIKGYSKEDKQGLVKLLMSI